MTLESCLHALTTLYNKYNDKPEFQQKIEGYVLKELPSRLNKLEEKEKFKLSLIKASDIFINEFLINSSVKYSYIQNSQTFIKYDGINYQIENESNIVYNILSLLSKEKKLIPWKYKIKNTIMKKIKETSLFNIIPESKTIQHILNFLNKNIFQSKEHSKYFLTVIGDNILQKKTNITHIFNISSKETIITLQEYIGQYFKNKFTINTTFKFSPQNIDFNNYRIILLNKTDFTYDNWIAFIKANIINILAISVHYSTRFGTSEEFLNNKVTPIVKNEILMLSNKGEKELVNEFITNMIGNTVNDTNIINDGKTYITVKELLYIWKIYVKRKNYPDVLTIERLIDHVKSKYLFKDNCFYNIKSDNLQNISYIDNFWKNNIIKADEESEITELCELYNINMTEKYANKDIVFLDEDILSIYLNHFYGIEINNKYIYGYRCTLWDKYADTDKIFTSICKYYKKDIKIFEKSISFIYLDYCRESKKNKNKIVSKRWFEKYIIQKIPEKYIIKQRILNNYWLNLT